MLDMVVERIAAHSAQRALSETRLKSRSGTEVEGPRHDDSSGDTLVAINRMRSALLRVREQWMLYAHTPPAPYVGQGDTPALSYACSVLISKQAKRTLLTEPPAANAFRTAVTAIAVADSSGYP